MPNDIGAIAGGVVALLAFAGLVYAVLADQRRRRR